MRKVFDIYLRTTMLFPSIHYEEDGLLDKLCYLSRSQSFARTIYTCFYKSHTWFVINQNLLELSHCKKIYLNLSKISLQIIIIYII